MGYTQAKKREKSLASFFPSKPSISVNSTLDFNDESLASISHSINTIDGNIANNINNSDINQDNL